LSPRLPFPQIARAVLPPEPIPRSGIGGGLLAHVIVSKIVDHLPLHKPAPSVRREPFLYRKGNAGRQFVAVSLEIPPPPNSIRGTNVREIGGWK
jgi:hypothetical protein